MCDPFFLSFVCVCVVVGQCVLFFDVWIHIEFTWIYDFLITCMQLLSLWSSVYQYLFLYFLSYLKFMKSLTFVKSFFDKSSVVPKVVLLPCTGNFWNISGWMIRTVEHDVRSSKMLFRESDVNSDCVQVALKDWRSLQKLWFKVLQCWQMSWQNFPQLTRGVWDSTCTH